MVQQETDRPAALSGVAYALQVESYGESISVGVKDADSRDSYFLESIPPVDQTVLRYENIRAWVSNRVQPPGLLERVNGLIRGSETKWGQVSYKQILCDITGEVQPGEVLALMGPSGSGKTSLLSVLAGRAPSAVKLTGKILANQQPLAKAVKRRMGFVLQDDVLHETLTVYETLLYAALLRLPGDMTRHEKEDRVRCVVRALGLDKCQDTIIGGFFRRGVSGGERKRVSIGVELLINPVILLLDEPTSGLDSTTAMHLIQTLRQLALGGRAIATTIHQPSSRLYQQLDKLMLLSEGHVMYYGAASQVATWFTHLGFSLPYGVNVADFILDLAMGEVQGPGAIQGKPAIQALYRTYQSYSQEHANGFFDPAPLPGNEIVRRASEAVLPGKGSLGGLSLTVEDVEERPKPEGSFLQRLTSSISVVGKSAGAGGEESQGKGRRVGAKYWDQLTVLFMRSIKVRRFESLSSQKFLQLVLVALVTGLFWWQRGANNSLLAATDTMGLIFFAILFPSFSSLFGALFTFPNEYRMLLKERASGMYQLSAYYLARTSSDLPMDCLYPSLFVIIIYFMGALRLSAGAFFATLWSVLLVVLLAQSVGLMLGAIFMNPKNAQTVSTVIMLTFMLVGGYYVRGIPAWIAWVKYLSFVYWGYNLLLKIEYSGRTFVDCGGQSTLTVECVPVPDVSKALNFPTDAEASPWPEVVVLLGMLVLFRVLVYLVLRKKTAN